jgi:hypothetical protein
MVFLGMYNDISSNRFINALRKKSSLNSELHFFDERESKNANIPSVVIIINILNAKSTFHTLGVAEIVMYILTILKVFTLCSRCM